MRCECGSEIIIKYGKTSADKQRFKCTECGTTFIKEPEYYTKTEKRLLSMLINFLDFKSEEHFNLPDFVKLSREKYHKGSGRLSIEKIYDSSRFDINKAKAVICQDGDKVLVYEVKEKILEELTDNRRVKIRPYISWRYKRKQSKKLLTNLPQEVIDRHKNNKI